MLIHINNQIFFLLNIVPVELVDHHAGTPTTALATPDRYGCSIDDVFYPEGAQVILYIIIFHYISLNKIILRVNMM